MSSRWPKDVARALVVLVIVLITAELSLRLLGLIVRVRPEPRATDARVSTTQVLCVGDSYTYGVYVDRALTYPSQLQAELERLSGRPYSVVNAGMPGQNTAMMRRRLTNLIEQHHPQIVIALGGVNNAWNAIDTQEWGQPSFADRLDILLSRSKFYQLLKLVRLRYQLARQGGPVPQRAEAMRGIFDEDFLFRVTRDDLVAMAQIAAAAGVRFVSQSYPYPGDDGGYFPVFNAGLAEAAKVSGTEFVDQAPFVKRILDRYRPEDMYFADLHPKIAGYQLMALNLAAHITGVAVDAERAHSEFMKEHGLDLNRFAGDFVRSLYNDFPSAEVTTPTGTAPTASLRPIGAPSTEGAPATRWSFTLALPLGSSLVFRNLQIPENATLVLGFTVDEPLWKIAPDAGRGLLTVRRQGTGETLLAERFELDPSSASRMIAVHRIDLAALAGETVGIELAASAKESAAPASGEVLFVEPVIKTR